jgi:hypothetical protein
VLFQALDSFNTAVVAPVYYVMFTILTIFANMIMYKVMHIWFFHERDIPSKFPFHEDKIWNFHMIFFVWLYLLLRYIIILKRRSIFVALVWNWHVSCPTRWARKFNVHNLSKLCPYLFSLKRNAVSMFLFNELQYFVKGLWYWLEFHSKSSIPTQKFSSDLRMQQRYHMTVAALLYCRTGTLRMQHR